jgi:hypothetical protein
MNGGGVATAWPNRRGVRSLPCRESFFGAMFVESSVKRRRSSRLAALAVIALLVASECRWQMAGIAVPAICHLPSAICYY